jgi:hypothetical protein
MKWTALRSVRRFNALESIFKEWRIAGGPIKVRISRDEASQLAYES